MSGWFAPDAGVLYDASSEHDSHFERTAVEATVDFLEPLAKNGALELAIGTGRIAVPLAGRGVRVAGIDYSPSMVAQLRTKRDDVPVEIGDYATTRVEGTFSLVYLVYNSITNLTTQEAQAASFVNAAAHLEAGGCFVIEVGMPPPARLSVFVLGETHIGIDEYDAVTQRLVSHHFTLHGDSWRRGSDEFRAVSPAELDLMASAAAMRLRERWGGWRREPFTATSTSHVSVWEKSA